MVVKSIHEDCWRGLIGLCCGGICHPPRERRDAGVHPRGPPPPLAEPPHVQPHRRQDMAEMDPREARVAGAAQACAPRPVRDRACEAGAARIRRPKGIRCLPLPGCLEGLIVWLGPINLEVLGVKATPCAGLPVIVKPRETRQIHAEVILTLDQPCHLQAAGVHEMGPGQEAPLGQRGVDMGGCRPIGRGSDGGVDARAQV